MTSTPIDWEQLDMIADGFAPDFVEIYYEYLAEMPGLLGNLRQAVLAEDAPIAARVAHQIKGSSANFGFIGVSHPASELEQEAKEGSLARGLDLTTEAENGFQAAAAEVKARVGV